MPIERCQREYCGGWARLLVSKSGEIDKICGKCAYPIGEETTNPYRSSWSKKYAGFNSIFKQFFQEKEAT